MSYVVVWDPEATDDIDGAWESSSQSGKALIINALTEIERLLRMNPLYVGESRGNDCKRVLVSSPVTVYYRVDLEQNFVRVYASRVYRLKGE